MSARPRDNWIFQVQCMDCGDRFDVEAASYSTTLVSKARHRMALLTVPNECPSCRNLRAVKGGGK